MALLVAACLTAAPARVPAQQRGLTGAARIADVYDAIFDARFEEIPGRLQQICRPGARAPSLLVPSEVCQLLDVVALWWRIQLDPEDRSRDATFSTRADAAIAAIQAWTEREPERAEAWFYLGGAYGARAQWRVLRGERLAAARDGKRIKESLEHALAIDSTLQDAYFGIGLYHYYADVAPTAAKVLRWLLLMPGGDKAAGMREMLRARSGGQILRGEADYQLHLIYLWYEKRPHDALALLRALHQRHPRNPHFLQSIAEVEDVYLHDLTASLRSWQALLDAARSGQVAESGMAQAYARLGIARQLDRLYETDAAVDELRAAVAARPVAPHAALARAQVQLGQALNRLGRRAEAVAAYRAALDAAPKDEPFEITTRARAGLRTTPKTDTTTAYRLSLEGWRALQRGALAAASAALVQSLALRPDDRVTHYRHARLLQAQGNVTAAVRVLESIIAAREHTPPTFYASACLDLGRLYEASGDRANAITAYTNATTVFGADTRTKDDAQNARARLTGESTPPVR